MQNGGLDASGAARRHCTGNVVPHGQAADVVEIEMPAVLAQPAMLMVEVAAPEVLAQPAMVMAEVAALDAMGKPAMVMPEATVPESMGPVEPMEVAHIGPKCPKRRA